MRNFIIAAGFLLLSASASHASPVGPVADKIVAQEIAKCVKGVAVPGGCFGPNGEVAKALRNIRNDLTRGPGDGNEITGKNGWVRRTFGW